jgi:heme exporter protein CcmD
MSHDFYLWMSYGATAIALAVEVFTLRLRRAKALRMIEEERDIEAED